MSFLLRILAHAMMGTHRGKDEGWGMKDEKGWVDDRSSTGSFIENCKSVVFQWEAYFFPIEWYFFLWEVNYEFFHEHPSKMS